MLSQRTVFIFLIVKSVSLKDFPVSYFNQKENVLFLLSLLEGWSSFKDKMLQCRIKREEFFISVFPFSRENLALKTDIL